MPLLVHPGLTVQTDRGVRFHLQGVEAHTVRLAADFTRWSTAPLALDRNGSGDWELATPPLNEGVHFYKYIVDGRWTHDPAHPMVEPDGSGGWNSVFGIGGPSLGSADNLRIATLNLRTYQENDPLLKLEQTAFALAAMNIDAVALQEVGEHISDGGRPNAGEVIRTRLQELTGQSWTHAWRMAHLGFDVYREGVSLLVAPLEDVAEYRLSQGRLARNALAATVTLKGVRLRLISTHCTWATGGGLREMQTLLDNLRSEASNCDAVLLAGVLNAADDEPPIKLLRDEGFLDVARQVSPDGNAFPTATPQPWQNVIANSPGFVLSSRIDYQMLRPASGKDRPRPLACVPIFNGLVAGDLYQPRVSDHIGVLGIYSA